VTEGLSRDATVALVGQVKARETPKEGKPKAKGKGRGATAKPRAKLVSKRVFKNDAQDKMFKGYKITVEHPKGISIGILAEVIGHLDGLLRQEIREAEARGEHVECTPWRVTSDDPHPDDDAA
jgi:hypothetical protein